MRRWVTVVLLGCALAGCADAGTPPAAPSSAVTPTDAPGASEAADRLDPALEQAYPDTYSGLSLEGDVLVVHRVPDQALDAEARRLAGSVPVEFRDARFSLTTLRETTEQVTADLDYWRERDVRIGTVGPRPDGNGVLVTTLAGEKDLPALTARYGDVITVEQGTPPVPATQPPLTATS
ncbi:hypothetical protein AB0G02_31150 [Actinosynnema sp. NPDC023658]|uniref:hypothetical protein n=1 Tax=Actinosynnema sp. NPDC023658 TaxID=3155465 RepID=UPI0033DECD92